MLGAIFFLSKLQWYQKMYDRTKCDTFYAGENMKPEILTMFLGGLVMMTAFVVGVVQVFRPDWSQWKRSALIAMSVLVAAWLKRNVMLQHELIPRVFPPTAWLFLEDVLLCFLGFVTALAIYHGVHHNTRHGAERTEL